MRVLGAIAAALLLAGCSVISLDLTPRVRPLEEKTVEGHGKAKILLTDLSGFLSDEPPGGGFGLTSPPPRVSALVRLREELKKAEKDPEVKALVLKVNSPGGTVTAADIMFRELEAFKRTKKVPVVTIMMDLAASGGYYVALAGDTIIAHPTTVTGSIGVIMLTLNAEGLMQKVGVATAAIKSGTYKDMGSPFRPLTPEERVIFQSVIDGLYGQFVAKVVDRRHIPLETAKALADGRVYTAQQALAAKLIDRIGYVPDAIDLAKQASGIEEARVIVYHRPREYRATYYATTRAEAEGGVPTALAQWASLIGPGPKFLYLWLP